MNYRRDIFSGYLIKGQLREAVDYLAQFPGKRALLDRYYAVFRDGKAPVHARSTMLRRIVGAYQAYYRKVFWDGLSREEGMRFLCGELTRLFPGVTSGGEAGSEALLDALEAEAARAAEREGYRFLGGTTSGWYGPYIWKTTEPVTYSVILPAGEQMFTIYMMDGFVSRSWLDFLSLGKVGTGGWTGDDGALYCVRKCYSRELSKPSFTISFLKHEAQHAWDKARYPKMEAAELEYRAKLAELVYYPDITKFRSFLREADGSDPANAHAMAAYRLLGDLSQAILGSDYESNYRKWYGKQEYIRKAAKSLLEQAPTGSIDS